MHFRERLAHELGGTLYEQRCSFACAESIAGQVTHHDELRFGICRVVFDRHRVQRAGVREWRVRTTTDAIYRGGRARKPECGVETRPQRECLQACECEVLTCHQVTVIA